MKTFHFMTKTRSQKSQPQLEKEDLLCTSYDILYSSNRFQSNLYLFIKNVSLGFS